MLVLYKDDLLERIELELVFAGGYDAGIVNAYRRRIQLIRAAPQEDALLAMKSLRMERRNLNLTQYTMHVRDGWKLIINFEDSDKGRVAIVATLVEHEIDTEQPS